MVNIFGNKIQKFLGLDHGKRIKSIENQIALWDKAFKSGNVFYPTQRIALLESLWSTCNSDEEFISTAYERGYPIRDFKKSDDSYAPGVLEHRVEDPRPVWRICFPKRNGAVNGTYFNVDKAIVPLGRNDFSLADCKRQVKLFCAITLREDAQINIKGRVW
jgi:hypothetical protein